MKEEQFKDKIKEEENLINTNNSIKVKISYIRLLVFILFVVFLTLACFKKIYAIPITCILFIAFVVLQVIHVKYFNIVNDATYRMNVYKDYLNRFSDSWKKSNFTGSEFKDKKYFETDLDIFGKSSLYTYINFSRTAYGKAKLADKLKGEVRDIESIKEDNEAIDELVNNMDMTINITKASYEYNAKNQDTRVQTVENGLNLIENEFNFNYIKLISPILTLILLIVSITLSALNIINGYLIVGVIAVIYFINLMLFKEASEIASKMAKMNDVFYGYNHLIDEITKANFTSNKLKSLQDSVKKLNSSSIKTYKTLETIAESRNNVIFSILLNGTISIDAYLLLGFKAWQKKYASSFREGLMAIGEIEALISLSTISFVKEEACFGSIDSNFEFDSINHPLIKESVSVPNSFKFEGLNIITGSNMSGKTTFMRSIGTNYILFLAGSMVCAKSFKAPILKMFTSMKVVDDVNNNISTFYGEILRVKEIVEYLKTGLPMLVLIDEIFKGTNTKDRITGAIAVSEKLKRENVYAIITTHDPELCVLDDVKNFHFLEHYENDEIKFDYKIKDGISTTRNAIYLLKLAGIIDKE